MSTENPIRVGIAGLGRAGWSIHALTLENMADTYKVVAVSDPDSKRQEEAKERLGCRAYADYDAMLRDEDVELVVVATPSYLHADNAVAAMRVGKHVLCEKPFATSLADADRMIQTSKETGRILTGSQNYRYHPDVRKVREVIESGCLGEILLIRIAWHGFSRRWDWQTLKEYGGGSLNNSASHVIDQALLFMGDAEPEVFCQMLHTPLSSGDAEDHVKVVLKAPNAPLIDIEVSSAVAYAQDRWLICGTQGGLKGGTTQFRWKYFDPSQLPERPISRVPTPDRSYNREDLPWVEETADIGNEPFRSGNQRLYEEFYETIRHGAPLTITPESVRRQIAVLEKCRELSPV
jgi:predicted dehydrogenase